MHSSNYALEVLVNGRPMTEYYKDSKSFTEAREGSEYTLRFRNNSWKRVLAIFSVDGIEVLKGKAAAQAENGYIVDAFSSIEIKGYRIDEATVAAFKFTGGKLSYAVTVGAAKTTPAGETTYDKSERNNGVIGVRVFEEDVPAKDYTTYKQLPVAQYSTTNGFNFSSFAVQGLSGCIGNIVSTTGGLFPFRQCNESDIIAVSNGGVGASTYTCSINNSTSGPIGATCSNTIASASAGVMRSMAVGRQDLNQYGKMDRISASALSPSFDVGSTWGTQIVDKIKEVAFKRAATSVDLVIYYASRASLEQFGIDFSRTKQVFSWPAAFEDKKAYCKVPPGYVAKGGV